MIETDLLTLQIELLLKKVGLPIRDFSIQLCAGGGNNRIYKIMTQERCFIVKKYFKQRADKRNRLATEFAFLNYAKMIIPAKTPIPYGYDGHSGLAVYEFIDGQPLQQDDISEQEITQAIQFFVALNQHSLRTTAQLPLASEACFSLQEHFELIDSRILKLQQIVPNSLEDQSARELIYDLSEFWKLLVKSIKKTAISYYIDFKKPLDPELRCISPSDFGFHNAVRKTDGTLCFLDFEYAGWDDPAKMAGDFFSQLAVPVADQYFDSFVSQVMQPFDDAEFLKRRAHILRLAYRVKWCCIALNIFLPEHMARRRFANPDLDETYIKKRQILVAERLIKKLELYHYG